MKKPSGLKKEIFISHGKDLKPLNELKNMLVEFGLTPVVLSEQPSGGKTVRNSRLTRMLVSCLSF